MSTDRLSHALSAGLVLPSQGRIALFGASGDAALDGLDPARIEAVVTDRAAHDVLSARGIAVRTAPEPPYAAAIVTVPRVRALAEARLAMAEAAAPDGLIVVDGAKTDGVEAVLKALRGHVAIDGQVSKAHGKVAWFRANGALAGWARPAMAPNAMGDMVAPGVFSPDAPDPGSVALADALPQGLSGRVADLGAGWGWLSREILRRPGVTALDCVEIDAAALDCARANVTDPRARFHWADATAWHPDTKLDAVVTNPPFHAGRRADPSLGRAFIVAAARGLARHGHLWMVANRHLPYETELDTHFATVREAGGTASFKILHAERPKGAARAGGKKGRP